ncbi:MAG: hypothetical protein JRH11_10235 [Deltaproteobacteria bacterium]|nr:hypothetical protein [Deltaproteobacteria bacterium]
MSTLAQITLFATLTLAGCADASPAHTELATAIAVGREAWGLYERAPRLCGPAAGATGADAVPEGECQLDFVRGLVGPSFHDEDHALGFRFIGIDGTDVTVRSERDGGALEVEVAGRVPIGGRLVRVTLGVLAVGTRGSDHEEAEVALRARIEGGDLDLDLDEVRYLLREGASEVFYRTWYDTWLTPAGTFVLEDGVFEGERGSSGRWHLHAEGVVYRDGLPFASVELGGPEDARRAVVASRPGALEL